MKIKVSETTGAVLDWLVAKCEEVDVQLANSGSLWRLGGGGHYIPTKVWAQGGPIIEREKINLRAMVKVGHSMDGLWLAAYDHGNTGTMVQWVKRKDWPKHYLQGDTPLIAAMRCFVTSKLGEEVEVPEELLK